MDLTPEESAQLSSLLSKRLKGTQPSPTPETRERSRRSGLKGAKKRWKGPGNQEAREKVRREMSARMKAHWDEVRRLKDELAKLKRKPGRGAAA
jgi:hypothetical protein